MSIEPQYVNRAQYDAMKNRKNAEIAALKVEVKSLKQELGRHINRTLRDLQTITEVGH